jgi:hypothetical protein
VCAGFEVETTLDRGLFRFRVPGLLGNYKDWMFRGFYYLLIGFFQRTGRRRWRSRQSFSAPQLHPIFDIHSSVFWRLSLLLWSCIVRSTPLGSK